MYGELGASGTPLLLIPGAFMATGSMKVWAEAFAHERAVIVFDQQGHGRTPDTSREMSYEQFADDAAALLRALEVNRADVLGYSQGGGVALQLAIRHPSLVSKLVSMSATFRKQLASATLEPPNLCTTQAFDPLDCIYFLVEVTV